MAKLQKGVNDLKTWCLNNGDFGQQLMQEWTGECEDGKHYEIDEVSFGSHKKFKWRCKEGHEWYAALINRTRQMSCCPYCSGNRVSDKNNLENWCLNHGDFGQQLMNEWTGECDDGKHYKIGGVSFGSHNKLKWRCSEGHEWFADTHSRVGGRTACPVCSKGALVLRKV